MSVSATGGGGAAALGEVSTACAVSRTSSNAFTLFLMLASSRFSCRTVSVLTGGTSAPFAEGEQGGMREVTTFTAVQLA